MRWRSVTPLLWALAASALLAGCASVPEPKFSTEDPADIIGDGLHRVEQAGFQRAWLKPGISFSGYESIWWRYRDIAYRHPPGRSRGPLFGSGGDNYSLSEGLNARLSEVLRESFEDELQRGGFRRASGKGPGTLEARVGLVDLIVHTPLDTLAGEDNIYVDSIGSVTVLIDLHDSVSGELIARIAERAGVATATGRPTQANAAAAIYETRRLARDWATRLRALLQVMQTTDLS